MLYIPNLSLPSLASCEAQLSFVSALFSLVDPCNSLARKFLHLLQQFGKKAFKLQSLLVKIAFSVIEVIKRQTFPTRF